MPSTKLKQIKVLHSYAAFMRFSVELSNAPIGSIPRQITPASVAAAFTDHLVWNWRGVPVVLTETVRRRYVVYKVIGRIGGNMLSLKGVESKRRS